MRKYLHMVLALTVAVALAASSANVSAAGRANASLTPPKLKTGVTLHIVDWFDQNNKNDPGRLAMEKVASAWAKATHNHVVFDGSQQNVGGVNKICTSAPAGQAADLIGSPHDQLGTLWACKAIAPVPGWAWTPAQQKLYITTALRATTIGGKFYGMPWAIETTGLWYNKKLIPASTFAKGSKLTWSALIPKLQKLSANGNHGFAFDMTNFYYAYAFISGGGGYVFKITKKGFDYNNVGLATPGAVKGWQFIKDLSTSGKYKLQDPGYTYNQALTDFENGKLAVFYTGPWEEENFKTHNVSFGYSPLPSIDGKHTMRPFSGVQVYSVNAFSKNKNEAFSLLSYMTTHMQAAEIPIQGRPPVLKSLYKTKAVTADPVIKGLAREAQLAQPMPNIPEMNEVWTPAGNATNLVAKGQLEPASAAQQAVEKIKSDIAKAHGG